MPSHKVLEARYLPDPNKDKPKHLASAITAENEAEAARAARRNLAHTISNFMTVCVLNPHGVKNWKPQMSEAFSKDKLFDGRYEGDEVLRFEGLDYHKGNNLTCALFQFHGRHYADSELIQLNTVAPEDCTVPGSGMQVVSTNNANFEKTETYSRTANGSRTVRVLTGHHWDFSLSIMVGASVSGGVPGGGTGELKTEVTATSGYGGNVEDERTKVEGWEHQFSGSFTVPPHSKATVNLSWDMQTFVDRYFMAGTFDWDRIWIWLPGDWLSDGYETSKLSLRRHFDFPGNWHGGRRVEFGGLKAMLKVAKGLDGPRRNELRKSKGKEHDGLIADLEDASKRTVLVPRIVVREEGTRFLSNMI